MNVLRKAMAGEVEVLKPVLDSAYGAILRYQRDRTDENERTLRDALEPAVERLMVFRSLMPAYKQRDFTALEQEWRGLAPGDLIMLFDHCVFIMHVRLERRRSANESQQPWSAALLHVLDSYREAPAALPVEGSFLCSGIAASSGRAAGDAYVALDDPAISRVPEGSVLICRFTTPDLVPHLRHIRGLVTDQGGALSHAAIIARELAVPAVTGCGNATVAIAPGAAIQVDGDLGLVMAQQRDQRREP